MLRAGEVQRSAGYISRFRAEVSLRLVGVMGAIRFMWLVARPRRSEVTGSAPKLIVSSSGFSMSGIALNPRDEARSFWITQGLMMAPGWAGGRHPLLGTMVKTLWSDEYSEG